MKVKILLFWVFVAVVFVFGIDFFFFESLAQTRQPDIDTETREKITTEYLAKICSGHGGVNCSIVNPDTAIVCNDGVIDNSLISIYAVPQCQETLKNISKRQSDFMAESGCFPPSELRCINEESYRSLYRNLSASRLANSELGRNELAQCQKQIGGFAQDNKNYRQCLKNHGQPNFELSGKAILPILKAVFCPVFYGNKSFYNQDTDLCQCEKGYFMDNEQCVEASQLCKSKYGSSFFAQNGNCRQEVTYPKITPLTEKLSTITSSETPLPTVINMPAQTYQPYRSEISETLRIPKYQPEELGVPVPKLKNGIIKNIVGFIISSLKNIFKLF